MPTNPFADHTLETAPPAARRAMESTIRNLGYLPVGVARLAQSPQALDGFLKLSAMFETTDLAPVAREVVIMTIATRNACHLCVAMHTAKLTKLGADPALINALRDSQPLPDERLAALQDFTVATVETAGAVAPETLQTFLSHGYTPQNALEVVLGIGAYTLSTLANRMTDAPLDRQLLPFAWEAA